MVFNIKEYIEKNSDGRILVMVKDFPSGHIPYEITTKNTLTEEKVHLFLDDRTFSSADSKIGQALLNLCKRNSQLADLSRKVVEKFIKIQDDGFKKRSQPENKLVNTSQGDTPKSSHRKNSLPIIKEPSFAPEVNINLLQAAIDEIIAEAHASEDMKEIILEALLGQEE
ncbi:MAG: hypothetical protein ACOWWO_16950 [Peptococcaceae bacterium]